MSRKSDLPPIADTLMRVARPEMTPKQLLQETRRAHPTATKKDIVRAAFYGLIAHSEVAPKLAQQLHHFAVTSRGETEDENHSR